jgi:hypothetical protein
MIKYSAVSSILPTFASAVKPSADNFLRAQSIIVCFVTMRGTPHAAKMSHRPLTVPL